MLFVVFVVVDDADDRSGGVGIGALLLVPYVASRSKVLRMRRPETFGSRFRRVSGRAWADTMGEKRRLARSWPALVAARSQQR